MHSGVVEQSGVESEKTKTEGKDKGGRLLEAAERIAILICLTPLCHTVHNNRRTHTHTQVNMSTGDSDTNGRWHLLRHEDLWHWFAACLSRWPYLYLQSSAAFACSSSSSSSESICNEAHCKRSAKPSQPLLHRKQRSRGQLEGVISWLVSER